MEKWIDTPIGVKDSPSLDNITLKEVNEKFVDIYTYSNGEIKA